ncbi:transposase [Candidatus Omnitrophota bacterium]
MPNGPRLLIDNACYHIITRANHRQRIFYDQKDYIEYLERLRKYKKKYKFLLYGYCLMPNHIHLLGEIRITKDLSRFMSCLQRSYTAYFNKRYTKVGHLWQGRFKTKVITKDKYLLECINYIEANPVKANIVNGIHEYKWSSYLERILGENQEKPLLNNIVL